MFFRNLTFFRFPAWLDVSNTDALGEQLAECPAKPVGPLELASRGFVPPLGHGFEALCHQVGAAIWITLGGENKILPAAAVNRELAKRLREIEAREGRKPGGKTRKRIKDEVIHDLLPRALVKPYRLDAYLDTARGFIVADTSSRKAAEGLGSEVRLARGTFPALPLNAEVAPRAVLTGWLAGDPLPDGLSLGSECELRDPADSGGVVRIRGQEMVGEEIAKHLEAGKQCTRLALVLDDRVSFVLGEDLVIRKFKILDGALEQLDATEPDDLTAELSARFALLAGEVGRLFDVLERVLKLSKADG